MCKDSLTIYAEERHAYQATAVSMAGETLAGIQAKLEDDIAQAQAAKDSADKEKASLVEAETAAKGAYAGLEESVTGAKATVDADVAAEKSAKAALDDATTAEAEKAKELADLNETKASMTAEKEKYEPLKTGKAEKKIASGIVKCFEAAGLEEGLVESLAETLKKEAVARGSYDTIVFKEVDGFIVAKLAELEAAIAACPAVQEGLAKAKEEAKAAFEASEEKLKASKTALEAAEAASKEGKKAASEASSKVKAYGSTMAKVEKTLTKANSALLGFQEGPKKCFEELKSLAPPPEPEPEVAVPVEEPAATTDAYSAPAEAP
jgi:hypothetical protein